MKYLFAPALLLAILLLAASCSGDLPDPASLTLEERIREMAEPAVLFGSPSAMVIGIYDRGETQIFSYGDTGLEPPDPHSGSVFEIGSITKTFTGSLLSQFLAEGILHLDDPLDAFFPEAESLPRHEGDPITLRHLVTHSSGLPREARNFNVSLNYYSDWTSEDYLLFLVDVSAQAFPFDDYTGGNELPYLGTSFRYSNIGMALLGRILEIASGRPFEQLVKDRIAGPLGMQDTGIWPDLSEEQRGRVPVALGVDQRKRNISIEMGRLLGAGALLSTMDDMLRYMGAQMEPEGTLFPTMSACHRILYSENESEGVGMAWFVHVENGDTLLEHNGMLNHMSHFTFNKSQGTGVIILSNGPGANVHIYKDKILELITEKYRE